MRQAGGREGNVEPAAVDVHEEEAEGKKKPAHSIASVHSAYSRTLANTFLRLTQEQTDDPASTKPAPEEVMMQRCKFANAEWGEERPEGLLDRFQELGQPSYDGRRDRLHHELPGWTGKAHQVGGVRQGCAGVPAADHLRQIQGGCDAGSAMQGRKGQGVCGVSYFRTRLQSPSSSSAGRQEGDCGQIPGILGCGRHHNEEHRLPS
eukprot:jgi/Mesvir1/1862/Mv25214-RA.1